VTLQSAGADAPEIQRLGPWFHNLHLPTGTETAPDHPLGDFPACKWGQIARFIPEDLTGWRTLDIGCNAGFYSFELARRGADVVGIDIDEHYLRQARWARDRFGLDVEFRRESVYGLGRTAERFDLVLFLGVLYHLRYFMLGLDIVAEKVARLLIFQTLTMPGALSGATPNDLPLSGRRRMGRTDWPKVAFIEKSLAGDPTNWWAPNEAAVHAMLRSSGLEVVQRPGHELYVCRPNGGVVDRDELRSVFARQRGTG
jgi:tRNA (mo5U34)-methyltransferase